MAGSGEPVYRRVAERLAEQIARGTWAPGVKIPSERELAEEFGISRMTARASVDVLADHGLVQRRERVGAFVAPPKVVYDVTTAAGFSDQLKAAGMTPGAAVHEAVTRPASTLPANVRQILQLETHEPVHLVMRIRTADGEPIALENSCFPAAALPDLLSCDLTASIYQLMRDRFGRNPVKSVQEIDVLPLNVETAQILGTSPDSPSLVVERYSWDEDGAAIVFARDIYRSDRIRLRASSLPDGLGALSAQAITIAEPEPGLAPSPRGVWRGV